MMGALLLCGVQLNGDFDVFTQNGSGEGAANAEIRAMNGGGGGEAHMLLLVHALDGSAGAFDFEDGWLGDAFDGEVAGDLETRSTFGDAGADKGRGGELGNVEETVGLEVVATGNFARAETGDVDGGVDG